MDAWRPVGRQHERAAQHALAAARSRLQTRHWTNRVFSDGKEQVNKAARQAYSEGRTAYCRDLVALAANLR
jgi:hypothetical protein